jgi:Cu-Zn family superoxide dismutase
MNPRLIVISFLVLPALAACSKGKDSEPAVPLPPSPVTAPSAPAPTPAPAVTASAALKPASGSSISGTVRFTETPEGVRVVADISGLAPGAHGFHVHEKGDCSDPEAKSAGGHFNPATQPHGAPDAAQRHAGDLGNLTADDAGHATLESTDSVMKLSGPDSVIGRAVIVHAGADDFTTQPTGDAGGRVACGVIEAATPAP